MSFGSKMADFIVGGLINTFCSIDRSELSKVPDKGPFLVVTNHINFLEVPVLHLVMLPRCLVGMVKKETWRNPVMALLANLWKAISLDREGSDLEAFRKAGEVLKAGGFLAIAPEGTRSGDGKLLKGHPGIAALALINRVPILPLVHYGGEDVWKNLKRIRKTRMVFKVGKPFLLNKGDRKVTGQVREEMTREIMFQMALHLPEKYRGFYSDTENATTQYLEFI